MIWCIQHAKKMPAWTNYTVIIKDPELYALFFATFFFCFILFYLFNAFENVNYDLFITIMKMVQFVTSLPTKFIHKWFAHRMFLTLGSLSTIIITSTGLCFYILVIRLQMDKYQIHTRMELIDQRFQLVGDQNAFRNIETDDRVSEFFGGLLAKSRMSGVKNFIPYCTFLYLSELLW